MRMANLEHHAQNQPNPNKRNQTMMRRNHGWIGLVVFHAWLVFNICDFAFSEKEKDIREYSYSNKTICDHIPMKSSSSPPLQEVMTIILERISFLIIPWCKIGVGFMRISFLIIPWCKIGVGFMLAGCSVALLSFIVKLCEFGDDDQWFVFFWIYVLQFLVNQYWSETLINNVSLVLCCLISIITFRWAQDRSGFIYGILLWYLSLLVTNLELTYMVYLIIIWGFYSKVTEHILPSMILKIGTLLGSGKDLIVEGQEERIFIVVPQRANVVEES